MTSVPSDSPDDFAALRDLKNKQVFLKKCSNISLTADSYFSAVNLIQSRTFAKG